MPDPDNQGQFGNREDTEEQANRGGQASDGQSDDTRPEKDSAGEERTDGEPLDTDSDDDEEEDDENRL